jgi:hypothetical protein
MRKTLFVLMALGAAACAPMQPAPPASAGTAAPPQAGLIGSLLLSLAPQHQGPPAPGRLLLSNLDFGPTHVEALVTAGAACTARPGGYLKAESFVLPEHGTRIITAPPGADVCWRRDRDPDSPVPRHWTDWARAYLAPGRVVDSAL